MCVPIQGHCKEQLNTSPMEGVLVCTPHLSANFNTPHFPKQILLSPPLSPLKFSLTFCGEGMEFFGNAHCILLLKADELFVAVISRASRLQSCVKFMCRRSNLPNIDKKLLILS